MTHITNRLALICAAAAVALLFCAVSPGMSEAAERPWVGTTVAPTLPGYVVEEHYGICWVTVPYSGHGALNDYVAELIDKIGAYGDSNAVVNLRISQGSFEEQGSKWSSASIIVYGDCVKLRKGR